MVSVVGGGLLVGSVVVNLVGLLPKEDMVGVISIIGELLSLSREYIAVDAA